MGKLVLHEILRTKYTIGFVSCYTEGQINKNLTFGGDDRLSRYDHYQERLAKPFIGPSLY